MDASSQDKQHVLCILAHLTNANTLIKYDTDKSLKLVVNADSQASPLAQDDQELLQAWCTTLAHGYRLLLADLLGWFNGDIIFTATSLDTLHHVTHMLMVNLFPAAHLLQFQVQCSVLSVRTGGQHPVLQLTRQAVHACWCDVRATCI